MKSRQFQYQTDHRNRGLCISCPKPVHKEIKAGGKSKTFRRCLAHLIAARNRQAVKRGSKKTYRCASRSAEILSNTARGAEVRNDGN